jgi:hypothetical protein
MLHAQQRNLLRCDDLEVFNLPLAAGRALAKRYREDHGESETDQDSGRDGSGDQHYVTPTATDVALVRT